MNFSNLNIKLVEDNGFCDVLIRVDDAFASEFGEEFGPKMLTVGSKQTDGLCKHIRSHFLGKNLRRVRIVMNGLTLATLPLAAKEEAHTRCLGLVSTYIPPSDETQEDKDDGRQLQDYVVKPGDTLWIIAAKFNTTSDRLSEINELQANPVEAGHKISVPLCMALSD